MYSIEMDLEFYVRVYICTYVWKTRNWKTTFTVQPTNQSTRGRKMTFKNLYILT